MIIVLLLFDVPQQELRAQALSGYTPLQQYIFAAGGNFAKERSHPPPQRSKIAAHLRSFR
jgi:hypothetical protein